MAIVKMSKFTLFTFESQKEALLDKLHRFGNVQFINLQEDAEEDFDFLMKDSKDQEISELEGELAKIKFSLDMLNGYVEKEKAIKALIKGKPNLTYSGLSEIALKAEWENTYASLKAMDNTLNNMKNDISKLHSEVESLEPWINLDCAFSDLKELNSSICIIGTLPKNFKDSFREKFDSEIPYSYVEILSEVKDEINMLVVVHKEYEEAAMEILKSYSFSKANLNYSGRPKDIIVDYNQKMQNIKSEEEKIKQKIKEFGASMEELSIVYEYMDNKLMKAKACENFLKTEHIVAIEGWVPTELVKEMEGLLESVSKDQFYVEFEDAELDDAKVPIMLKNNKLVKAFESITQMYSLPKYSEVDPTPLLTPFYLAFFGMMLADLGYGIVMFIVTALALKFFNLDESQKNFARFFLYLSIPTAIVGAIYGGFFGDAIKIPALINPSQDVITILIASMIMGLVQLYFGLGIKAYMLIRDKKYLDALYDVGSWYAALTGGLLLLAKGMLNLSPTAVSVSKYVMIAGMVLIVITQGRENKSVGARLGAGLYALYGISGYVGDLVSYSRLMALGLAGGFIGSAFNLMIGLLGNGPAKWIFGTLIFLVGHIFNLLLSALGAYVHTCRLQYVEYFGKFYEGGGLPFTPFKSKNKYVNIKNN